MAGFRLECMAGFVGIRSGCYADTISRGSTASPPSCCCSRPPPSCSASRSPCALLAWRPSGLALERLECRGFPRTGGQHQARQGALIGAHRWHRGARQRPRPHASSTTGASRSTPTPSNALSDRSPSIARMHSAPAPTAGAEHWATIASLIETCKLIGVEPHAYLADIISRIVQWPSAEPPLYAVCFRLHK